MDLLVNVERPDERDLTSPPVTSSERARERVGQARERQRARLSGTPARCNGELDGRLVQGHVRLDGAAERLLARAYASGTISARGRHRILRVARTIADLEARERIVVEDVLTALGLRQRASGEESLAA
jgi:magnesium chelatase family protein